ncbi:MAG TPA: ChaN family lipoprotein [Thermoanaerobaculia bacterium]|nr:ChaN family lipoprotein [Thermoanaerobaculia bacterium]
MIRTAACLFLLLLSHAVLAADCDATRRAAVDGVFDAFATHQVVLFGEQHQRKEFHEFLRTLIRDRRFTRTVTQIVVEFGNARYQDVADRYVAGREVPRSEMQHVWRDVVGTLLGFDSPVYEEFYDTVREVNRERPADERIRVILGDPPVPWSEVHDAAAYGRYIERDQFMTDAIQHARKDGRRVLVIVGGLHIPLTARPETMPKHPGVGDLLESAAPHSAYRIFSTPPALRPDFDCAPQLLSASGELGDRSFGVLMEPGVMVQHTVDGQPKWVKMTDSDWPPVRAKIDAALYLGPTHTRVDPLPSTLADTAYIRELHRRAKIMHDFFGFDFESDLPPAPPE